MSSKGGLSALLTGRPGDSWVTGWARRRGQGKGRKRRSFRRRPCVMQLQFQQSFVEYVEAPQFQFIDRVVGISVASLRHGSQCKTVQKIGDSQVQFLDRLGHARCCATTSTWRDRAENCGGSAVAAFSGSSIPWTRLLTRPLVCNVRLVVQTVRNP